MFMSARLLLFFVGKYSRLSLDIKQQTEGFKPSFGLFWKVFTPTQQQDPSPHLVDVEPEVVNKQSNLN